jgi:hypothetical protein
MALSLKRCTKCRTMKPQDAYYGDKRAADGCTSQCRDCLNASAKRRREEDPELKARRLAADRSRYRRNKAHKLVAARRWNEEHPERHAENSKDWRERNPEQMAANRVLHRDKENARKVLARAVARGDIVRPERCEDCGGEGQAYEDGRSPIQGHHEDYDKPLEVAWLCRRCHGARHREPLATTS